MEMRRSDNKDGIVCLKTICIVLYLLLFSLLICFLSRQNILSSAKPNTDSSVFMTIAKGMISGGTPYLDFFDHKGPFLYLLNYIGYSFGGTHGVWGIEVIAITIAVFFTYATVKKLFGRMIALCSTTTGYILLRLCLEGGNLTEEYALPLISIAVYITISILLSENSSVWQSFVLGLTFGLSLMLRPNMFSIWFIFSAYWVIASFVKNNYQTALRYILFFLIGTVISVLPFFIYLLHNNALHDYIYQNFIFNSQYASYGGIKSIIKHLFNVTYSLSYTIILSLISYFIGFVTRKRDKKEQIIFVLLFLSVILTIVFISISQATYGHYFIVFIPIIAVAFGVLFELLSKTVCEYGICRKWNNIFLFGITFCLVLNGVCRIGLNSISLFRDKPNGEIIALVEKIDEYADENDTLQVLGNNCSIYLYSDVKPANKFIYDYPIANISSEVHEQFVQAWATSSPTYVIAEKTYEEDDTEHIKWVVKKLNSQYEIVFETENYILFGVKA